jgi:hypothetical protein
MQAQTYYVVRSKTDGQYLVARLKIDENQSEANYLLLFQENYEALSYLNTHGTGVANRFAIESVPSQQLRSLAQRWSFKGFGLVRDPLEPQIQFLSYDRTINF